MWSNSRKHKIKESRSEISLTSNKEEVLFQKLEELMEKQKVYLQSDLQREDIASYLHTNRTYLTLAVQHFSKEKSIIDYVNSYRLVEAVTLINEHPDWSVGKIAKNSGFNSRETFNRVFKRVYNMTPSEYRHKKL